KELISEDLTVDAYVGAGSLIHLKVALTAAHVVAGKQNLTVRAGEWNLKSTDEEFGHSSRNVSSTVVHEKYDKEKMLHDVALLFLKQSMFAVPNVGVACLPPSDQLVPEDWKCIASGWGKFKKGETQHILKKVLSWNLRVDLTSNPVKFGDDRSTPIFELSNTDFIYYDDILLLGVDNDLHPLEKRMNTEIND
ncbi:jg22204, partial [Pararge aegeria aegeria]